MAKTQNELTISRIIKAPRSVVWKAWADPQHFEKWWTPEPIKCRVVKMDLQAGGGFETQMSENGVDFEPHVEGCFLEIIPQEKIVFTTVLSEGWQPIEPWLAMTAAMTMQDEGGDTRYVARAFHRSPDERQKHEDMGFQEGWGSVIEQLAKLVET